MERCVLGNRLLALMLLLVLLMFNWWLGGQVAAFGMAIHTLYFLACAISGWFIGGPLLMEILGPRR
jgi:hypothetical protein